MFKEVFVISSQWKISTINSDSHTFHKFGRKSDSLDAYMPKNSQKKCHFILLTKYLDGTNQIFLIGRKSKNKAVKKGNFVCKSLPFLSKEFSNELRLDVLSKLWV